MELGAIRLSIIFTDLAFVSVASTVTSVVFGVAVSQGLVTIFKELIAIISFFGVGRFNRVERVVHRATLFEGQKSIARV